MTRSYRWIAAASLAVVTLALPLWSAPPASAPSAPAKAGPTSAAKTPAAKAPPAGPTFQRDIAPFLQKHCFACHGGGKKEAGLALDKYQTDDSLIEDRKTWENVLAMVRSGEMPPEKRPRPTADSIQGVLTAIDGVLARFDCNGPRKAGRVTLRRLNKAEYNNTIRDLVGVDFQPAAGFPADDVGYGFDNIGDVLTLSPLLLEKYLAAAESVLERAIVLVDPPKPGVQRLASFRITPESAGQLGRGGTFVHSRGALYSEGYLEEGDYTIRVEVYGQQAGDESVKAAIRLGRTGPSHEYEVTAADRNKPQTLELKTRLKTGTTRVSVSILNPFTEPTEEPKDDKKADDKKADDKKADNKKADNKQGSDKKESDGKKDEPKKPAAKQDEPARKSDAAKKGVPQKGVPQKGADSKANSAPTVGKQRRLYIRSITVDGPYNPPPIELPAAHKKLMAHKAGLAPREAAREIVARFATAAFRRPVRAEEVDNILKLYDQADKAGERFENSVRTALYRVLVSPHFLFRVELDPANAEGGKSYPVSEYELASRLSYFLWNSMPDDELFAHAASGKLRANLAAQTQRMLASPKSQAFVENFASQWLTLRSLDAATPDSKTFPKVDAALLDDMRKETELFFAAIVREDRSILDLLDADFTFVNEPLAKHYGISGVRGKQFQRVKAPPHRSGILTQASILTLTSNPTRTSPVKRGKWVLEQILNTPPPPPPPDVPALEEEKQLTGSLRQVLEQHRANPVCASCHERMDPIGFAFENFDAVGAWRTSDGKFPIDPAGRLPDGQSFDGPAALIQIIKAKKELFARCLAEKMLTYALGRGLEYYDKCAVDQIVAGLARDGYKFSALVAEVVRSEPLQMRTATGKKKP